MNRGKEKLYRKVNTGASGVFHDLGGDYKNSKNKKKETIEQVRGTMFVKKKPGIGLYTTVSFFIVKSG